MNHETFKKLLSPYRDGVLPLDQRTGLERHLKSCGECRKILHDWDLAVSLLFPRREISVSARFTDAVMARVRAENPLSGSWMKRLFDFLSPPRLVWVGGGVLATVLFVLAPFPRDPVVSKTILSALSDTTNDEWYDVYSESEMDPWVTEIEDYFL